MTKASTLTWPRPLERGLLTALAAPFDVRTRMPTLVPASTPILLDSVALTFDDGPDHHTPYFLEPLQSYGIKATFFVVGEQVQGTSITGDLATDSCRGPRGGSPRLQTPAVSAPP